MPLHGKIVVIKRSGGDGTEFPLTATCLFGRKPDCDIRIQLPQVSKEHCRIDLNENKEVILTNLSSVNPTLVNGEVLQQSERLKHGDTITIIDRSFRFEYPPAPTPKKRSSTGGKVLQDQQVGDTVTVETDEKRISQVSTDLHLKDGTNHDNIQRCQDKNKTVEMESKDDSSLLQNKSTSPFGDLYQMIKKSLDVNTPLKSSSSLLQTPSSRFCTPKPGSVRKNVLQSVVSTKDKTTPKKAEVKDFPGSDESKGQANSLINGTPSSVKKQRTSFQVPTTEMTGPTAEEAQTLLQKRNSVTPQKFTVCEVVKQIAVQKSPIRRRSKDAPAKLAVTVEQENHAVAVTATDPLQKASPVNSGSVEKVKEISRKRRSGELGADLPKSQMKKKRVSFGGYLSPELFDKRLPPDSPLRRGATPRRSLCLTKPKQSVLRRRASVIGNLRAATPAKKSPKSKTPSPKAATPAKKSPKSKTPSPKAATPAKKSPKSKTPSPKTPTPAKKSPKSKTPPPKAATPAKKSPISKTPSPKTPTPAKKSPKSKAPSPKAASPESHLNFGVQTPTVQGRFSVSRISTPSPVTAAAVSDQVPSNTVTPKIPLRRKSMKSASRKTQSVAKSAVKVMLRRSGISRASMKAMHSWADIVKCGQTKTQVAAAPKRVVTKKPLKKAMSKPQTPARKVSHFSTGHAASPMDIVVGRASKKNVVYLTGAAPRVVTNIALYKKDMKMDEDLTGISELFKTPVNQRKRSSVINNSSVTQTPVGSLGISAVEPSVLTTPEEPGEMMVSPLSMESTVKTRQYNDEAVQRLLNVDQESSFVSDVPALVIPSNSSQLQSTTPKQKPELQECLTGVKRIMKTPRQKAEPVEDLRGKLLKTPKEKPENQECLSAVKSIMTTPKEKGISVEDTRKKLLVTPKQTRQKEECLTGVKRIMKTPKQKAEPVEDIRGKLLVTPKQKLEQEECLTGVKRLMKTPREKGSPVECHFGIKRLMKSPRMRGNAPVEDFDGLQQLLQEPLTESTKPMETHEVEDKTEPDCGFKGAEEVAVHDEPQDNVLSPLMVDVPAVDMPKVFNSHMEEAPSGPDNNGSFDAIENVSQAAIDGDVLLEKPKVQMDKNLSEEQPEVKTTATQVSGMERTSNENGKKSIRSKRARTAQSEAAEDKQEATERSEDLVVPAPARGRRWEKSGATAPPAVRQPTRNRGTKNAESKDAQLSPQPPKAAVRPRRGKNVAKVSEAEVNEQDPPVNVEHQSSSCAAPPQKALSKPRQGRKTKPVSEQSQSVSCTVHDKVPQADVAEDPKDVCSAQLEEVSNGKDNKEAVPQVDTASCKEKNAAVIQTKSVRGRRGKILESKAAENKQEANPSEASAFPALVRGRRGTKHETAAPSALRQSSRNQNSKSPDQVEILQEKASGTEISAKDTNDHILPINASQEANYPAVEAAMKPKETKMKTPVEQLQSEPKKNVAVIDQHLVADPQPQQLLNVVEKPKRGRRTKPEPVNQVAEDTVVTVVTKPQPVARARRGRNAEQEDKNLNHDGKTTKSEGAVKTLRRTRNPEQDNVEPRKEVVQSVEVVVEPEASPVDPTKINEQPAVAPKPRRGGRKAKPGTEPETPVESVPAVCPTDKPKRGRRGKQITEESGITTEVPEEKPNNKLEAEDKTKSDPNASVIKSSRTRVVKTEASQTVPSKRARRGAALDVEVSKAESAVPDSESDLSSTEPSKRGRRAAAKSTADNVAVSSHPGDLSSVEDTKMSKRSVKWKTDLEVFEIPTATTCKAVRGRKSKRSEQVEAESRNVSKDANTSEEEDLSGTKAEAPPVKKARRGAKVAEQAESSTVLDPKKDAEAETQPKTRRGRSAKK